MGGFVYILGPCGSLQWTLLWVWEFLPLPQTHRFFQSEVWGFISPCWNPGLRSLSQSPVVPPSLSPHKCGTIHSNSCCLAQSSTGHLTMSPHHPSCLSPPLLPVWKNVSSLTPWLSDFHTVRFYVISGCFLFLNLLLPFFWVCEEAQCIVYLHFHIGQKSDKGRILKAARKKKNF